MRAIGYGDSVVASSIIRVREKDEKGGRSREEFLHRRQNDKIVKRQATAITAMTIPTMMGAERLEEGGPGVRDAVGLVGSGLVTLVSTWLGVAVVEVVSGRPGRTGKPQVSIKEFRTTYTGDEPPSLP